MQFDFRVTEEDQVSKRGGDALSWKESERVMENINVQSSMCNKRPSYDQENYSALRQMVSAKGIIDPGRAFDDQGTARVSKETCSNISNIRQVSLSRSWG